MNVLFMFLFTLTLSTATFAQQRDYRAELEIKGSLSEIGVTPNGTVWLSTSDAEFFVLDVDSSGWRYGPSFGSGNISQITFFNDTVGIATGSVGRDGFYRTSDGGTTWNRRRLGGDVQVYCTFVDVKGDAWAGGSSGNLLHSSDQGLTWNVIPTPFGASKRLKAIYMDASGNGILGSLGNDLVVCSDHGRSYRSIATPADQHSDTRRDHRNVYNRIQRVARWHSWFIVEQIGRVWYTDTSTIQWNAFPEESVTFTLDEHVQRLYTVSMAGHVVAFDSTFNQVWKHAESSFFEPMFLTSSNGTVIVQEYSGVIHRVRKGASTHSVGLYTFAKSLKDPRSVRYGQNTSWGFSYRSLYARFDQSPKRWFRVANLDSPPEDLTLIDDTTAIVWTRGKNLKFTINSERAEELVLNEPLAQFLKYPVVAIQITSETQGCFHHKTDFIRYVLQEDGSWSKDSSGSDEGDVDWTSGSVVTADIDCALKNVDQTPGQYPPLTNFRITDEDIATFRTELKHMSRRAQMEGEVPVRDEAFYERFIHSLDSLQNSGYTVQVPLYSEWWSTTMSTLTVTLTNGIGEQLTMTSDVGAGWAWGLPFDVNYHGLHFSSMSMDLARMIKSAMPNGFLFKDRFNNARLLDRLAFYIMHHES